MVSSFDTFYNGHQSIQNSQLMKNILILLYFLSFSLSSFSQNLTSQEGFINVEGGRIWYKVIGSGKKTPLLIIHGGPGGRGDCSFITPFTLLSNDRPIIFYDQLGSGRSDKPTDTLLWQLPRFVNEIDSLRAALGLEKLHIMGQSWGGTVLIEYLISKKPKGVVSAIFASPLLSTPIWMQDAKVLLSQLPKNLQDTIDKYEALKEYNAPSYVAANDSFSARHISVTKWPPIPAPECAGLKRNSAVYNYMWGPTEFNATGTLENFDRTPDLYKLKLPVLFIAGEFDEARPETMYRFQKMIRKSKVVILERAGHSLQVDQPLKFPTTIRTFINTVD